MNKWNLYSPEGMQDIIGENCRKKKETEENLRKLYLANGFSEIETPVAEYYDVFYSAGSESALKSTYKMVDEKGRITTLRPDMTIPAARVAATKINDGRFPVKLFYCGRCFRSDNAGGGKQKEFTESGVEIIGSSDPFYDALVIFMAVKAMKTAGIEEFIIELGQVGFSERLMEMTGLPEDDLSVLKDIIDSKDSFGVEEFLSGKTVAEDAAKLLLKLPGLSGGEDMLRNLRSDLSDENLGKAVDGLLEILGILDDFGVLQYISVDLSMVRRIDYYTGMIFRGLTYGMGFPVLSGGRYDDLSSSFNKDMPATGFSISIDLALAALYRNKLTDKKTGRDGTLVCFGPEGRADALTIAVALQEEGVPAELYPADDEDEAISYAGAWGLDGLILVLGDGMIESIDMETNERTKGRLESLSGGAS